jgi:small subunit ribosomal protein S1
LFLEKLYDILVLLNYKMIMKKILNQENLPKPLRMGEVVEGKIVNKGKSSVFLDLGSHGTGIIFGKEFYESKEKLKNLETGTKISAKIIGLEDEEGYVELSLSKANKEIARKQILTKKENNESIQVKISGANKGGLLTKVSGIPAFIPVSQLSSANYPKVEDGDNQKILRALQKFIDQEMEVKILDFDPKEEKLILSEKAKEDKKTKEALEKYKIGDLVEGEITGIVNFGAFLKFPIGEEEESLEGLVHISELDWQLIEDPSQVVKVGQKVKAKIIDIANNKISLSVKALKKDPWQDVEKKYKKGDIFKGKVIKINPFGAFVQASPKIQGLAHISEFDSQKNMEEELQIGEKYDFQILSIEPSEHRMSLKIVNKQ